ncbi:MAG: hypothetical protein KDF58_01805 [Alphaproteobacteria bacterium]|nr:hypothetical protein [Alphaproteobacteria bacterium]HPF47941.1 hypothetical protein [Emcibacteraceae bacterium]
MDILLQLLSYCFIPLLAILVIGGLRDIFHGLKEHMELSGIKIPSFTFVNYFYVLFEKVRIGRIQSEFCRN